MTKLVNLDSLAGAERSVKYKGVSYPVSDLSVRDFITASATVDRINKAFAANDMATVVAESEKVIRLAVPTFPPELLATLNMRQTTALVGIVMDVYPDGTEEVASGQEPAGNA